MNLDFDRRSSVPVFRQLADGVARAARRGSLKAGHRLPSSRELAAYLGVNRLTVESAYDELERQGLIERRHGSGTFVLPSFERAKKGGEGRVTWPSWQAKLGQAGEGAVASAPAKTCPFDFSGGMGDPGLIPSGELLRCFRTVLRRDGPIALGYENAQGFEPLRKSIAEILSSQGLPARAENILITTGSQQAISLCAQALLNPGDTVFVEEFCYDSALALFRMLGLKVVPLPMDGDGLMVEKLDPLIRKRKPGLLYCMPNFQNPTGRVLSARRRRLLVELATRHDFPILEDDYVGELRYEGNALPCLKALDTRGCVLYTSTFSKMLMPGLRLGYLLAEGPAMEYLCHWKKRLDIANASVLQRALQAFVSVGRYRRHVRQARRVYRKRRDALLASIAENLPEGTLYQVPSGGLFLWLRVPGVKDSRALLKTAAKDGIAFVPGDRFLCANQTPSPWLRLNFAMSEIPVIEEGMKRLGACIARQRNAL